MSTTFDYTATARRVTSREVSAARLAPDYAALVGYFGITSDTPSGDITKYARAVICHGAPASAKIDEAHLKGTDPGDVAHRVYWLAARAVRAGLIHALGKADAEPKAPTLRVSLSGEGGGSSVVPMDSDLGKAILAFLESN